MHGDLAGLRGDVCESQVTIQASVEAYSAQLALLLHGNQGATEAMGRAVRVALSDAKDELLACLRDLGAS